jgi:drug/metabolite transporter (DMT)-like permease
MTAPELVKTENRTAGILWMLATMLCFIVLDAIMKYGLETMSLVQVTWGRFFFATLFAAMVCGRDIARLAVSEAPGVQAIRSCFLMVTTGLFNAGIATSPLATATTIMFLSPIFVTALATLVLSEQVGLRRWSSIAVGFLGALVVVSPWQDGFQFMGSGIMFLIAAAFTNSCYQITTRKLRHDDPMTSLLFTASAGAVVTTVLLHWHWSPPNITEWALLIASGAMGLLGHLCIIKAFQAAPASVVAPFSYSALIWATTLGFLIWNDWPTFNTLVGAFLIISSGLYIFFRERYLKQATLPPGQAPATSAEVPRGP